MKDVQPDDKDKPKFYKRDLLAVLKERNELKEELESLRDELAQSKASVTKEYTYNTIGGGSLFSFGATVTCNILILITAEEGGPGLYTRLN